MRVEKRLFFFSVKFVSKLYQRFQMQKINTLGYNWACLLDVQ